MKEEDIIKELTLNCASAPRQYGVGDDCAMLGNQQVVSTDSMIEGVHFDERLSPEDVGWKIVAVNASDIAAMGRAPKWATLNLCLPKKLAKNWVQEFASGMRQALTTWNINLIGGDVVRTTGPISITMTMGGSGRSKPVWRNGAIIGHPVYVTGYLGEAAAGFFEKNNEEGLRWLRRPKPHIEFAYNLGILGAVSSMIDLSDGLHKDLIKLCEASNVGAVVYPDKFVKGPALSNLSNVLAYQTSFGEDYELLFTAKPGMSTIITQISRRYRVRVTEIGRIISVPEKGPRAYLKDIPWPKALFSHF